MSENELTSSKIDWTHLAVIGAAGKMGRGIALLLLQELAGRENSTLTLIDANPEGFPGVRRYLRTNLQKTAEKAINQLRGHYADRPDLIDNGEMIQEYVTAAMDRVRCVTSLEEARGATMIFEAIIEDLAVKAAVLQKIDTITGKGARFFTNTSSIPIGVLQKESGIGPRLIGFHFYNPPAVQKLLELVTPEGTDPSLHEAAVELSCRLKKSVVEAGDVAGFIGNGHFIREIAGACDVVDELSKEIPQVLAIQLVNRITHEYLIRPMGIFQLVDYVGIDVCRHIARVMGGYLPDFPEIPALINTMVQRGIVGGQNSDGSQKEGFFRYERGLPVEVYDPSIKGYIPLAHNHGVAPTPEGYAPWKVLSRDPHAREKIARYFSSLMTSTGEEAALARKFLLKSREISRKLVEDGVAKNIEDVDRVLKGGFFHLYGSEEPFLSDIEVSK